MKKAKQAGTDPYLTLFDWRNTPFEGMFSYPVQRMFGRRIRTLLPTTSYLLKPKVQEDVKEKRLKQKSKQAKYYNQNTKELSPLQTGKVVRVAHKPDGSGNGLRQKWKTRLISVLTKSEQKTVDCTEETVASLV